MKVSILKVSVDESATQQPDGFEAGLLKVSLDNEDFMKGSKETTTSFNNKNTPNFFKTKINNFVQSPAHYRIFDIRILLAGILLHSYNTSNLVCQSFKLTGLPHSSYEKDLEPNISYLPSSQHTSDVPNESKLD